MTIDGGTATLLGAALTLALLLAKILGQVISWKMEDLREKRRGDGETTRRLPSPALERKVEEIHKMVHAFDGDGRPRIWIPQDLLDTQRQIVDTQRQIVTSQQQLAEILNRMERQATSRRAAP